MATYKNLDLKGVKLLAKTLAREVSGRDVVIGLVGDLGAGKTLFTRTFAKTLGINGVSSPTFIVVSEREFNDSRFYHIDFYRLTKPVEMKPLGIDEIISSSNRIVLIEWVDRFPAIKNRCDIIIEFKIRKDNRRDVTIRTN